jgi:hypothetical protein
LEERLAFSTHWGAGGVKAIPAPRPVAGAVVVASPGRTSADVPDGTTPAGLPGFRLGFDDRPRSPETSGAPDPHQPGVTAVGNVPDTDGGPSADASSEAPTAGGETMKATRAEGAFSEADTARAPEPSLPRMPHGPSGSARLPGTGDATGQLTDGGDPRESGSTAAADAQGDPDPVALAAEPRDGEAPAHDADPLRAVGVPEDDPAELGGLEAVLEAELLDMADEMPLFVLNLEDFDPHEAELSSETPICPAHHPGVSTASRRTVSGAYPVK